MKRLWAYVIVGWVVQLLLMFQIAGGAQIANLGMLMRVPPPDVMPLPARPYALPGAFALPTDPVLAETWTTLLRNRSDAMRYIGGIRFDTYPSEAFPVSGEVIAWVWPGSNVIYVNETIWPRIRHMPPCAIESVLIHEAEHVRQNYTNDQDWDTREARAYAAGGQYLFYCLWERTK